MAAGDINDLTTFFVFPLLGRLMFRGVVPDLDFCHFSMHLCSPYCWCTCLIWDLNFLMGKTTDEGKVDFSQLVAIGKECPDASYVRVCFARTACFF